MSYTFKLAASPKGTDEIDALEGSRRDQFIAAIKGEMGTKTVKAPSDYFLHMADELDEDADDQYAELWTISKEGKDKTIFDLWYFPSADNGAVFEAGTTKPAGVEIIQGELEASEGGGKKAEKLAEELQDGFDDREAEDDEDEDGDDDDDEDEDEDEEEEEDEED